LAQGLKQQPPGPQRLLLLQLPCPRGTRLPPLSAAAETAAPAAAALATTCSHHQPAAAATPVAAAPCSWGRRKLMAQNSITPKHTTFPHHGSADRCCRQGLVLLPCWEQYTEVVCCKRACKKAGQHCPSTSFSTPAHDLLEHHVATLCQGPSQQLPGPQQLLLLQLLRPRGTRLPRLSAAAETAAQAAAAAAQATTWRQHQPAATRPVAAAPCSWVSRKLMAQNFITPKHTTFPHHGSVNRCRRLGLVQLLRPQVRPRDRGSCCKTGV
jgi:hypothetical protein